MNDLDSVGTALQGPETGSWDPMALNRRVLTRNDARVFYSALPPSRRRIIGSEMAMPAGPLHRTCWC